MVDLFCSECDCVFEHEDPFGDNVQCPDCKEILSTDYDDDMCFWVTGKADERRKRE